MAIRTESFESLTNTLNSPLQSAYFRPGFQSIFQFSSGLKLLSPIPNNSGKGVYVGDFSLGNASWDLLSNGNISSALLVPHGTAYLGVNSTPGGNVTFSFDAKVYTVSAYVDGAGQSHDRIAAYDFNGNLISGASIRSVPVGDWDSNLIQVMSKKPIFAVVFTGDYIVVDDLKFDTSKPNIIKGSKTGGTIKGTNGNDLMLGKKGNEKIKGKDGDDTIDGKGGNDKIKGGDGNDTLVDGKGANKIWGNDGQDTFLFKQVQTLDILKDFNPVDDTIFLYQSAFNVLPFGQLGAFAFGIGAVATNPNQRMLYDPATGMLRYDQDGTGPINPIDVATLPGGLAMTAADFFIA